MGQGHDDPELAVLSAVDDWPGDRRAAGVLDGDGVIGLRGDVDVVLPLASVTKPLAAFTVLRLVADGTIDLDEPAGRPGSTVRHLLAHAAGYEFSGTEPAHRVGRRRVYSNTGFDVLADHVTTITGATFAELLDEHTTGPLGMTDTTLEGSPAHAGRGTVRDLLRFADELRRPTLLPIWLHAEATTPVYPQLDGVLPGFGRQVPNPWGLGFEVRGDKQPHWTGRTNSAETFGHFGQSGSMLWVDPKADVALTSLSDEPFGPWAMRSWPVLSDAVLDAVG